MTCNEFADISSRVSMLTVAQIAAAYTHRKECPECYVKMKKRVDQKLKTISPQDFLALYVSGMATISKVLADPEAAQMIADANQKGASSNGN